MSHTLAEQHRTILFYDGECGLCSKAVQQILKRDTKEAFRYAPLQGNCASQLLPSELTQNLDSVVLLHQDHIYTKSSAFIKILEIFGNYRGLAIILKIIPNQLRDLAYDLVAKNRHHLFRPKQSCQLLDPKLREKLFFD